ncbi:MAG: hypothetical protein R3B47_18775 [Bacteroidia bacterium]
MHYEESLGEVAGNGVSASFGLQNLRGLSSIEISEIKFSELDANLFSKEDATAKGTFALQFEQPLSLDAEGKVIGKVSLGPISGSKSESIDADLKNSGSKVSGEADFVLGSVSDLEVKSFTIDNLKLHMGDNKVELHGSLGMFNPLLDDLTGVITERFNSELSGHIASVLKLTIQEAVNSALPMKLKG